DHVEPVRMQHEIRGKNIDVIFVPLHLGEFLRHRLHALVPIGHRDGDAVGFRGRGQVLLRPPTDEYSPSVFSRTTQKSMSLGLRFASGDGTPGISRTGRRFTYWSNSRRNLISEPHSEI